MEQLLEAESQNPVDEALLNKLRALAAEDTTYPDFSPDQRNALNAFFQETKGIFMREMMIGDYGSSILLDALIVSSFESGYKFGRGF